MAQFPKEQSTDGEFQRQADEFREIVAPGTKYEPESARYHLYVSLACPWAHRTLIARKLLGLEETISCSIVDPIRDERGWAFRSPGEPDPVNGFSFLAEAYRASDAGFDGRVTVPVLWDRKTSRIVNNSEDDICRMFAEAFLPFHKWKVDLFPSAHSHSQEALSNAIYEKVNNGVYRAGFATSQKAYERAANSLFEMLDELESILSSQRFLITSHPVESDWRAFCTLIRFDPVYHGHFKCNLRRIVDYPNLSGYLRDLYQWPGVAETVNLDHIKRHYYVTHDDINPTRIVPIGPETSYLHGPSGRDQMP
ncbi:putative glutathione S-transferase [Terrimicrobium sacchariphilum]|uniref:Putative glutathione S-transferase n=1 Tax=Terrimicrobium sacchariphilum TaxID=690879 RepID=A0A146GBI8_TERSA|nr:glutathione S-transferase family protein [Terrimicrobium sacchariphilum]GAT33896.1 putative glutathione S-transferase [Terrimicrobium sacchariphilum]